MTLYVPLFNRELLRDQERDKQFHNENIDDRNKKNNIFRSSNPAADRTIIMIVTELRKKLF